MYRRIRSYVNDIFQGFVLFSTPILVINHHGNTCFSSYIFIFIAISTVSMRVPTIIFCNFANVGGPINIYNIDMLLTSVYLFLCAYACVYECASEPIHRMSYYFGGCYLAP